MQTSSIIIAPSILAADFGRLADAARVADEAGAEYLHLDVMDGHFVPQITFGTEAIRALRPVSRAFFDAHLMISEPDRHLEGFVKAGVEGITVQAEVCVHLQRTLATIRSLGARAGVALNPATPPDILDYVMDDLDLILVMTVNPGFGGQAFLPATLLKIRQVREKIRASGRDIRLQVDGGIGLETAPQCVGAGADTLVAGTFLFRHPDSFAQGVRALREAAQKGQG